MGRDLRGLDVLCRLVGMNFEFMPELKWTYGYPLALLVIAGSCAALYHRFRQSGWL